MPMLERGEEKKDKYDTTTDVKDFVVDEKQKTAHFSEQGLVTSKSSCAAWDLMSMTFRLSKMSSTCSMQMQR
jgi:hypothetical protein